MARTLQERSLSFHLPLLDPSYDAVRSHPRFKAALKQIDLDALGR
jgi:hypothetical protein